MTDISNPDPPKEKEVDVPSISRQHTTPSILNTFIERIRGLMRVPPPEPQILSGRFQNLKQTFASTMIALEVTLGQMKEEGGDAYIYADAILTPLYREGERLLQQLSGTGIEQVRSVTVHNRWIENVNLWLLHFETLDAAELRALYIKQSMQDAVGRVDKDLQLIGEYLQQQIGVLNLDEQTKQDFRVKIEEELGLYLFELQGLKIELPSLKIEELETWKAELSKRRETYFNAALSVIDRHIAGETATMTAEEEHHHLADVLKEITALEEVVPHIAAVLKEEGVSDTREAMLIQVRKLKEKAYLISLDLRLPQVFQDRVDEVITTLEQAEKFLNGGYTQTN